MLTAILSRLMFAAAWCVGRLPLRWQQRAGDIAGRWAYRRNTREARVARRNLEMIAPELDASRREALLREVLCETGRNGFETLRVWTRSIPDNLRLIKTVRGAELLDAGLANGRGLIIAAPHFGNLEVVIEYMQARGPLTLVYRAPEGAAGHAFLRMARAAPGTVQVPAEANAMRPLWKALKAGSTVGITTDQQPKVGSGEFAPFFGHLALTLSLIPRLAERSGAAVVMGYAQRRADGLFDLHFEPAPPELASPDILQATTAMNAAVEAIARRDQRQYQWTYKRYTLRPPGSGETNPYQAVPQPSHTNE
jgi:KDO2-lipid IV(A) lauroyltransferase